MKSFSVLTVTKRTGWEKMAEESMLRQTLQPEKWIVITEEDIIISRYPAIVMSAPDSNKPSNLNNSLNAGLKLIDTRYVIFYQDFIELQPDCFEKLIKLANTKTFVTTCTPNYDGSNDIRYTGVDKPRDCKPDEWETNVALAPMPAIRDLGGFMPEMDYGWSWDNVNLAERAEILGYNFILDESNRPKLHPHEMTSRQGLELNYERHNAIMEEIRSHKRQIQAKGL